MKIQVVNFLIAIFILSISLSCDSQEEKTIPYKIVHVDSSEQQITFRMTIEDRAEKEQLIEIARQLKNQRNWNEKLVCFFDIKVPSNSTAWSSCLYLPECTNCNTDKDKDGNGIEYNLIGLTKQTADSLKALKFDSIPNKTFIASYIDDISQCKTELYKVGSKNSEVLMVKLFIDGTTLIPLSVNKDGEGERYLFNDDEGVYIKINKENKSLTMYNKEDKPFQTYPID